jgi:RecT family
MSDVARIATSHPIGVLRDQIAPDATDAELAFFAQVCARLQLSPFADQIVLIGRWDSRLGRKVHRHQITVTGRRVLAERSGELQGIDGPEWAGPRVKGELRWSELWDDDTEPPYVARVFVYRKGWVKPANGTAKWAEFAQTDNKGNLLPLWKKMPSHMLGKVAESMALRRAFPDAISPDVLGEYAPAVEDAEDLAELAEAAAHNAIDGGPGPEPGPPSEPEPGPSPPQPEPEPEPSPEPEPAKITEGQQGEIRRLYSELGVTDRADQFADAGQIIGRDLGSTTPITADEAAAVIATLTARLEEPL